MARGGQGKTGRRAAHRDWRGPLSSFKRPAGRSPGESAGTWRVRARPASTLRGVGCATTAHRRSVQGAPRPDPGAERLDGRGSAGLATSVLVTRSFFGASSGPGETGMGLGIDARAQLIPARTGLWGFEFFRDAAPPAGTSQTCRRGGQGSPFTFSGRSASARRCWSSGFCFLFSLPFASFIPIFFPFCSSARGGLDALRRRASRASAHGRATFDDPQSQTVVLERCRPRIVAG